MSHPIDNEDDLDPISEPNKVGAGPRPSSIGTRANAAAPIGDGGIIGLLGELTSRLAKTADLPEALRAVAAGILRTFGVTAVLVSVTSESFSEVVWLPENAPVTDPEFADLALLLADEARTAREPLIYAAGNRIKTGKARASARTLSQPVAALPLAAGPFSGAAVLRYSDDHIPSKTDREIMASIAGISTMALERVALQEMVEREQADRLRLEEELRISDERLRTAVQAAGIGTWHWDLRTGTLEWSESAYSIFDIPLGEPISYEMFLSHIHPADRRSVDRAFQSALTVAGSYETEHRVLLSDGSDRWVFSKGEVSLDTEGQPRRFEGVIQDIDGRRRLAQVQRFLVELSDHTRGLLDPDEILWTTVSSLGQHLAVDRCMYGEIRGDNVEAHRNYATAGTPSIEGVFPLSSFGIAEQLRRAETVVVDDIRTHSLTAPHREIYEQLGVRAHITVPLLKEGNWVGILTAHSSEYPRHWREHEVDLLQAVAERTWLALENARLYRASRDEITVRRSTERELANVVEELKSRYAHEHRIAATLQRSLLQMPPEQGFPGARIWTEYVPALDDADVGGDFLDAFSVGDDKIALVVGDVSGKGLIAAARTAEIKYTLRGFLREYDAPAVAMTRLNNVLTESVDPEAQAGFVCLSVIVLDPRNGHAQCSIAGAEAPMIVRQSGVIQSMAITGPPLTVVPRFEYDVCHTDLAVGDLLLMVTDGITEARSGRLFFGYEGLARAAAAMRGKNLPNIGAAIIRQATDFAGGRLRDDACLLLAQRTDDIDT